MLLERDGHLREGDFAGHLALLAVVGREDELQSPETFTANDVMASRASTCREIGEAARGRATREDEG